MTLLVAVDVAVFLLQKGSSSAADAAGGGHGAGGVLSFFASLSGTPLFWCAVALAPAQLLLWTLILKRSDISWAYPVVALSYPIAMAVAAAIFHEHCGAAVWAGAVLITLGAAVIGPQHATEESPEESGEPGGTRPLVAAVPGGNDRHGRALIKRTRGVFAYSNWDVVPVLAALLQGAFIVGLFLLFPISPWWLMVVLGLVYAVGISWNINGIAHNFIHNPYFRSAGLNRAFSVLQSLLCGFSQVFYDSVHRRHHVGNSDRQDDHGHTVDWLSIYRHGHDGHAENLWSYVFLSYFRDDIGATFRDVKRRSPVAARWGIAEIVIVVAAAAVGFWLSWKFMLFMLPFYYFGHCLSSLNGYYKHFGGNTEEPVAWGVSSYGRLYNVLWFNNGYHAEHHFRPRVHWTRMKGLHREILEEQIRGGTRVIRVPHALGFLDPTLRDVDSGAQNGRFAAAGGDASADQRARGVGGLDAGSVAGAGAD